LRDRVPGVCRARSRGNEVASAMRVTLIRMRPTATRVSMWSRERKLLLSLELLRPGPETTVVDVGVTDAPFGGGSSDNFFEALYPWPERITAVRHTELDPLDHTVALVTDCTA